MTLFEMSSIVSSWGSAPVGKSPLNLLSDLCKTEGEET